MFSKNGFPIDQEIYGDMFLSNLYSWEYTPPTLKLDFGVMFKWLENINYLLDPHAYAASRVGVEASTLPQRLNGFYNTDSGTDPGILARDGAGELHGPYIAVPPAQMTYHENMLFKGSDEIWRSWISQLITACFFYRFGNTIATAMGVLYSRGIDRNTGIGELTDAYASSAVDEKVVLADYSIAEIVDFIANTYADEEGIKRYRQGKRRFARIRVSSNGSSFLGRTSRRLPDEHV